MASKADLIRVGKEDFGLIVDERHVQSIADLSGIGKEGFRSTVKSIQSCVYKYHPQQALVYQVKPVDHDGLKTGQLPGGVSIMDDYWKSKYGGAMVY